MNNKILALAISKAFKAANAAFEASLLNSLSNDTESTPVAVKPRGRPAKSLAKAVDVSAPKNKAGRPAKSLSVAKPVKELKKAGRPAKLSESAIVAVPKKRGRPFKVN